MSGEQRWLTTRQMMQIGSSITSHDMETIAKRYLKLNSATLYRHRNNKDAYHREIIAKWARNNNSKDQVRVGKFGFQFYSFMDAFFLLHIWFWNNSSCTVCNIFSICIIRIKVSGKFVRIKLACELSEQMINHISPCFAQDVYVNYPGSKYPGSTVFYLVIAQN